MGEPSAPVRIDRRTGKVVATTLPPAPWTYDRERARLKTPSVRVAEDFDRWCVERLAGYRIVSRTHCPTRADAQATAAEIARVEGIAILPDRLMLTAAEVGADDDGGDAE